MKESWIWIPNKSLGPITIGSPVEAYINKLGFSCDEDSDDSTECYVDKSGDIYIDALDGLVESITSYREFYYKHVNLIGSSILELGTLIGKVADEAGESVEFEDGDVKSCYDYFDLGLQVWASRGIITSASCLTYDD